MQKTAQPNESSKRGTKNELDLLKQIIRDQEQFLREQQVVINQYKEELVNGKQEIEENKTTINDLLTKNTKLELDNKQQTSDNENVMSLFQTYQDFYKKQIEELEAQLINSKLELANKSADIDQYKHDASKQRKKIEEILSKSMEPSVKSTRPSVSLERSQSTDMTRNSISASGDDSQFHQLVSSLVSFFPSFRKKSGQTDLEKSRSQSDHTDHTVSVKSDHNNEALISISQEMEPSSRELNDKASEEEDLKKLNVEIVNQIKRLKTEEMPNEEDTNEEEGILEEIKDEVDVEGKADGKLRKGSGKSSFYKETVEVLIDNKGRSPSIVLASFSDFKHMFENEEKNVSELKIWQNEVMPIFKDANYFGDRQQKIRTKVQSLIKKFIPSKLRGKIWSQLIGNHLKINKKLYSFLLKYMDRNPIPSTVSFLIKEDLHRTYPQLNALKKGSDLNKELQTNLELFHFLRPDIGYVQGMAYLASLLSFHLDKYRAFKSFCNLITGNPLLSAMYKFKTKEIDAYFSTFVALLKERNPSIVKHLDNFGISKEVFLVEWFYTLYSRAFKMHTVAKIWDLFLYQGEIVMFKTGLTIFNLIEAQLIKCDFEETLYLIRNCTSKLDEEALMKKILNTKISKEKFHSLYQKELNLNTAGSGTGTVSNAGSSFQTNSK